MNRKYVLLLFVFLALFRFTSASSPEINFTSPTPSNGSSQFSSFIYVNVSSSDADEHYTFVDFGGSLSGWWRAEGNALDELGRNNGTVVNHANSTSTGKFNSSFGFDGVDDYISIADSNSINLLGSFAISFWVKTSGSGTQDLIRKVHIFNSTNSGINATASSQYGDNSPSKLFDGSATGSGSSGWGNNNAMPSWLVFNFTTGPKIVTKYRFICASGQSGGWNSESYNPKTWVLWGYNGSSWTQLDNVSDGAITMDQWKDFRINNTASYSLYRWNISAAESGTWVHATELQFQYPDYGYLIQTDGGKIRYNILNNNSNSYAGNITINDNSWHHIAVSYNGSSVVSYVDGVLDASFSSNGSGSTSGIPLYIGGNEFNFSGSIDELLIFNRSLSTFEMASIRNASANQYFNNFTLPIGIGNYTFVAYAVDILGNKNQTESRTISAGVIDDIYPIFSNYIDNNASLADSGIALFNVTVANTNGNVLLSINGNNYAATNLTANVYNVSVLLTSGTYSYNWTAYGNGPNSNQNISETRYYTVNATPPDTTPPAINFTYPTPSNGTIMTNTSLIINVTISDSSMNKTIYNWNNTNFTIYDNSLILMYNFDNVSSLGENSSVAKDLSLYNNSGVLIGASTYSLTAGKYGRAFQADGSDDYINITSRSLFNLPQFTLSLWWNATSVSQWGGPFNNRVVGQYGFQFVNELDNLTLFRPHLVLTNGNTEVGNYKSNESYSMPFSRFKHFVWTYNGTTVRLFVDGVEKNVSVSAIQNYPDSGVMIGRAFAVTKGGIDEVRVWNRSLSAQEAYQSYTSNLNKFNSTQWNLYINQSKNATAGLDSGAYSYSVYSVDSLGNENMSETRNIIVDTIYPVVNISYPLNSTYGINVSAINYTYSDSNPGSCWYSNNSGILNSSSSAAGINFTSVISAEGSNTFTVYCNDSVNNINYSSVTFVKDTSYPIFSNYLDNNGTLTNSGMGWFNATILNTNGTVLLEINNTNITAINLTANVYNASYSFTLPGTYSYRWHSWGNGTLQNYNVSEIKYYTVSSCVTSLANTSWGEWGSLTCSGTQMNQTRNLTQYDANSCGIYENETFYDYQLAGPDYTNTSWGGWYETTECRVNNTVIQERNLTQYDSYGCGGNTSYFESREVACDFCTPSLANTSWIDWQNQGVCKIDDLQLQNRSKTEYDVNNCEEILNYTYWEYQNISCNYCSYSVVNSSWTDWTNITCLADNTMNQTRNKTEYDENYGVCYAVTNISSDLWNLGVNNSYSEFRNILSCGVVSVTPATPTTSGGGGGTTTISECSKDKDCKEGYSCYSNRCVKLFDAEIINVESLTQNLSFPLTYLIKGMANIKGDVIIKFWLQNENKKISLGQDAIYLGSFEEKTKTTSLNLPRDIENGDYDLYVQVNFENYSVESFRKMNIALPQISLSEEAGENKAVDELVSNGMKIYELVKGVFSSALNGISSLMQIAGDKSIYFFAGLGILLMAGLIIILSVILNRRKPKDMTRLNNLKGLMVYSDNGHYVGRVREAYLEDGKAKIYGYLIRLNGKIARRVRKKNILVRYKHVNAVRHVVLIDRAASEYLEKLCNK